MKKSCEPPNFFPNSLFIYCLKKWLKEAQDHDTKFKYTLSKALKSIKKYPLPLKDGNEAYIIQGIGTNLANNLQKHLDFYLKHKRISVSKLYPNFQNKTKTNNFIHNDDSINLNLSLSLLEKQKYLENINLTLYIDSGETNSKLKKYVKDLLTSNNIQIKIHKLPVGDFLWVIENDEKTNMLPYIIERKRKDDLARSIKDGRYREQKFRLKKMCEHGIKPIYLIEDTKSKYTGLPLSSIEQAVFNTLIIDNFHILHSKSLKHSVKLLLVFHLNIIRTIREHGLTNLILPLSYQQFTDISGKNKNLTLRDVFAKQLMCFHGMSINKVQKITETYPTYQHLYQAYQRCDTDEDKFLLLSKVFSSGNKDKRCLFKQVSKSVAIFYNDM